MGFLGMSGKTWKKIGGYALKAAPIVAAPFTGGASLAALSVGAGAASGALGGGGWKGAALGGALGAIPGGGAGGAAAGTAAKTGLKAGLTQAAKTGAKQIGTSIAANQASRIPGVGGVVGSAVGAGLGAGLSGSPGASFGANLRSAGKAALGGAQSGAAGMAGNYAMNSIVAGDGGPGGYTGFGASPRPAGPAGYDMRTQASTPLGRTASSATSSGPAAGGTGTGGEGGGFGGFWDKWGGPIATGVGLGVGAYAGRKAQEGAMQRTPEEQLALGGAQGVGGDAAKAAKSMLGESKPWMKQAGNYYSTLLSGNRAAMSQAVAAPMAQISQQYRGAERGLERSGVRGAARDVAAGELGRERVGKMAGLTTGVQPYAAEQLGNLGINAGQAASGLYGTAGNVYTNLLGQGALNRQYGREEGRKTAEQAGKLAHDIGVAVGRQGSKPKTTRPVPGVPSTGPVTSGIPGGQLPGQQMPLPTVPTAPRATPYPGGRVQPPVFGPPTDPYQPGARVQF